MYQTGGNGDSFRVRFGNNEFIKWDGFSSAYNFEWELMPFDIVAVRTGFNYQIQIKYREEGAGIDKLLITNDMDYTPTGIGE